MNLHYAGASRMTIAFSRWRLLSALAAGVADVLLWVVCGFVEQNWLIPVAATVSFASGFGIAFLLAKRAAVLRFYVFGSLLRTLLCLFAWYQSKGSPFAYWTGLNDDSSRYFYNSYQSTIDAVGTTADPGFPYVNSVITGLARAFGQDHYLINVQLPLTAGILLAVVVFVLGRQVASQGCALGAACLIAFHPIVVGWSTGLMRDTLVAAAGWLMVYQVIRLTEAPVTRWLPAIFLLCVNGFLVWSLRNISCIYFMFVAVVLILFNQRSTRKMRGLKIAVIVASSASAAFLFFDPGVRSKIADVLAYGETARLQAGTSNRTINTGGLSERIAQSNSVAALAVTAPYMFIAPFPVYWSPVDFQGDRGRIVDYLMNLGGLLNLFLIPYFLVGLISWLRERQFGNLLVAGPIFYAVCFAFTIGTGQSRWMMVFAYPTYLLTVAETFGIFARSGQYRVITLILASMMTFGVYVAYWLLKGGVALWITGVTTVALLGPTFALFVALFLRAVKQQDFSRDLNEDIQRKFST
jgi:hypothetical protein